MAGGHVAARGVEWSAPELLVFSGAVGRHGVDRWQDVSAELVGRAEALGGRPKEEYSAQACKERYTQLKEALSSSVNGRDNNTSYFVEKLREKGLHLLRQRREEADGAIQVLQIRIKQLHQHTSAQPLHASPSPSTPSPIAESTLANQDARAMVSAPGIDATRHAASAEEEPAGAGEGLNGLPEELALQEAKKSEGANCESAMAEGAEAQAPEETSKSAIEGRELDISELPSTVPETGAQEGPSTEAAGRALPSEEQEVREEGGTAPLKLTDPSSVLPPDLSLNGKLDARSPADVAAPRSLESGSDEPAELAAAVANLDIEGEVHPSSQEVHLDELPAVQPGVTFSLGDTVEPLEVAAVLKSVAAPTEMLEACGEDEVEEAKDNQLPEQPSSGDPPAEPGSVLGGLQEPAEEAASIRAEGQDAGGSAPMDVDREELLQEAPEKSSDGAVGEGFGVCVQVSGADAMEEKEEQEEEQEAEEDLPAQESTSGAEEYLPRDGGNGDGRQAEAQQAEDLLGEEKDVAVEEVEEEEGALPPPPEMAGNADHQDGADIAVNMSAEESVEKVLEGGDGAAESDSTGLPLDTGQERIETAGERVATMALDEEAPQVDINPSADEVGTAPESSGGGTATAVHVAEEMTETDNDPQGDEAADSEAQEEVLGEPGGLSVVPPLSEDEKVEEEATTDTEKAADEEVFEEVRESFMEEGGEAGSAPEEGKEMTELREEDAGDGVAPAVAMAEIGSKDNRAALGELGEEAVVDAGGEGQDVGLKEEVADGQEGEGEEAAGEMTVDNAIAVRGEDVEELLSTEVQESAGPSAKNATEDEAPQPPASTSAMDLEKPLGKESAELQEAQAVEDGASPPPREGGAEDREAEESDAAPAFALPAAALGAEEEPTPGEAATIYEGGGRDLRQEGGQLLDLEKAAVPDEEEEEEEKEAEEEDEAARLKPSQIEDRHQTEERHTEEEAPLAEADLTVDAAMAEGGATEEEAEGTALPGTVEVMDTRLEQDQPLALEEGRDGSSMQLEALESQPAEEDLKPLETIEPVQNRRDPEPRGLGVRSNIPFIDLNLPPEVSLSPPLAQATEESTPETLSAQPEDTAVAAAVERDAGEAVAPAAEEDPEESGMSGRPVRPDKPAKTQRTRRTPRTAGAVRTMAAPLFPRQVEDNEAEYEALFDVPREKDAAPALDILEKPGYAEKERLGKALVGKDVHAPEAKSEALEQVQYSRRKRKEGVSSPRGKRSKGDSASTKEAKGEAGRDLVTAINATATDAGALSVAGEEAGKGDKLNEAVEEETGQEAKALDGGDERESTAEYSNVEKRIAKPPVEKKGRAKGASAKAAKAVPREEMAATGARELPASAVREGGPAVAHEATDNSAPAAAQEEDHATVAAQEVQNVSADQSQSSSVSPGSRVVDVSQHLFLEILRKVRAHRFAPLFRRQTDPAEHSLQSQNLGAIKQPMDLDVIRDKIERGRYGSSLSFLRDLLLVFGNALVLFSPQSQEYNAALTLREFAQKVVGEVLKDDQGGPLVQAQSSPGKASAALRSSSGRFVSASGTSKRSLSKQKGSEEGAKSASLTGGVTSPNKKRKVTATEAEVEEKRRRKEVEQQGGDGNSKKKARKNAEEVDKKEVEEEEEEKVDEEEEEEEEEGVEEEDAGVRKGEAEEEEEEEDESKVEGVEDNVRGAKGKQQQLSSPKEGITTRSEKVKEKKKEADAKRRKAKVRDRKSERRRAASKKLKEAKESEILAEVEARESKAQSRLGGPSGGKPSTRQPPKAASSPAKEAAKKATPERDKTAKSPATPRGNKKAGGGSGGGGGGGGSSKRGGGKSQKGTAATKKKGGNQKGGGGAKKAPEKKGKETGPAARKRKR